MKYIILKKSIIVLIILTPLFADLGCKKQLRCGCGKDVYIALSDASAYVYYSVSDRSAYFYDAALDGSTYWFCNPGQWLDTLQKYYTSGQQLLVTGNVFFDCTYYMNSGNLGYYTPPVYQVIVSDVRKNNYAKK